MPRTDPTELCTRSAGGRRAQFVLWGGLFSRGAERFWLRRRRQPQSLPQATPPSARGNRPDVWAQFDRICVRQRRSEGLRGFSKAIEGAAQPPGEVREAPGGGPSSCAHDRGARLRDQASRRPRQHLCSRPSAWLQLSVDRWSTLALSVPLGPTLAQSTLFRQRRLAGPSGALGFPEVRFSGPCFLEAFLSFRTAWIVGCFTGAFRPGEQAFYTHSTALKLIRTNGDFDTSLRLDKACGVTIAWKRNGGCDRAWSIAKALASSPGT